MTLYSTVWSARPPGFENDLVVLRRPQLTRTQQLRRLMAARDGDVVLVNGALGFDNRWQDLLLGLCIRLRGRRVGVLVSDATWHSRSTRSEARIPALHGPVESFGKVLLRAVAGPHAHVCFLSRQEVLDFASEARVPLSRVHFTPFFPTLAAAEEQRLLDVVADSRPGEHVFSGGNSSRDYRLLAQALGNTQHRVVVSSSAALRWPVNFSASSVGHDRFLELMARSKVVVVTLDSTTRRSVGQQTYLNAMALGLPVVVNDAVGVRDHVENGRDALVVPAADPVALREAVDWVIDPANATAVAALARRGQQRARELSADVYFGRLKTLLHQVQRDVEVER